MPTHRNEMVQCRGVLVHPRICGAVISLLAHHDDVRITSGWRSVARNKIVGGVRNSRHLDGLAIDVVGPGPTLRHLMERAPAYGVVERLDEGDHVHFGWKR